MNRKKIFAGIIAGIMLLTLILTACGDDTGSNENVTTAANNNAAAEDDESGQEQQEAPRILSEAPVKDFEGYEYRILSRDESYTLWAGTDADTQEINGDLINDAVYQRNRTIEAKYNIQIVNKPTPDIPGVARRAIMANSDEYDIMMGPLSNNFANTLSQGGLLADLKQIAYLDLDKPWYDQKANEHLTIANKLYVTVSEIGKVDKDATWSYLFNKKIVSDNALEDPYQLVKDGKWTIDKMLEMTKGISRDLNGDGVMGMEDMYGYAGETYNLYLALLSSGSGIVAKDNNDLPVYTGLDESGVASFTKLLEVLGDKNLTLRADDYYSSGLAVWGGTGIMDTAFMESRVLFFDTSLARIQFYRNMDVDFGIIPPPKRDEAQAEYICTVSARSTNTLTIPVTVSDFERTGIITDALAAESLYTLKPAYYDMQLKTKFARDNESAEMLDIIFAGRKFDLVLLYEWAGLTDIFSNAMQNNSPDIISALERVADRVVTQIEKTIEAYESFSN
jgi:hypothetical protein